MSALIATASVAKLTGYLKEPWLSLMERDLIVLRCIFKKPPVFLDECSPIQTHQLIQIRIIDALPGSSSFAKSDNILLPSHCREVRDTISLMPMRLRPIKGICELDQKKVK